MAAVLRWGAAAARHAQEHVPECGEKCSGPDATRYREHWGCDAPVPPDAEDVFSIRCPSCDGNESRSSYAKCEGCGGTGKKRYRRCPNAILSNLPASELMSLRMFILAWDAYEAHGLLPMAKGVLDQSAIFWAASEEMQREKNMWEERIREFTKER